MHRAMDHPESELRGLVIAELRSAIASARAAAAGVDHDANAAVHGFRKALRRARAVLALCDEALKRSDRRAIHKALREVRRALGPARDHAVLPEAVSRLPLDGESRKSADAIVAAAIAPERAAIAQALSEGVARAAAQLELVEGALPELDWTTLIDGARETYKEARRELRDAKHGKRAFHAWRRRTKELSYQLDLLARIEPGLVAVARALNEITDAQGPVVDLIMLRRLAREHDDGLAAAVDAQLITAMKSAVKAAAGWFEPKPSQFVRMLVVRA